METPRRASRRSQFSKRISQTELTALQEIKNYSEYVH